MPHAGTHAALDANWKAPLAELKTVQSGSETASSTSATPSARLFARCSGEARTATIPRIGKKIRKWTAQAEYCIEFRMASMRSSKCDESEENQNADHDGEGVGVRLRSEEH